MSKKNPACNGSVEEISERGQALAVHMLGINEFKFMYINGEQAVLDYRNYYSGQNDIGNTARNVRKGKITLLDAEWLYAVDTIQNYHAEYRASVFKNMLDVNYPRLKSQACKTVRF